MTREKFKRKQYFFYEKDSRFNPQLIHKSSFLIGQVPIEKYGLKTLFNIYMYLGEYSPKLGFLWNKI